MQTRSRRLWEAYRERRKECKRVVRRVKRDAKFRWGRKLHETFVRSKRMFWKEVGKVRKGEKNDKRCER